jgi:hypothetical protein
MRASRNAPSPSGWTETASALRAVRAGIVGTWRCRALACGGAATSRLTRTSLRVRRPPHPGPGRAAPRLSRPLTVVRGRTPAPLAQGPPAPRPTTSPPPSARSCTTAGRSPAAGPAVPRRPSSGPRSGRRPRRAGPRHGDAGRRRGPVCPGVGTHAQSASPGTSACRSSGRTTSVMLLAASIRSRVLVGSRRMAGSFAFGDDVAGAGQSPPKLTLKRRMRCGRDAPAWSGLSRWVPLRRCPPAAARLGATKEERRMPRGSPAPADPGPAAGQVDPDRGQQRQVNQQCGPATTAGQPTGRPAPPCAIRSPPKTPA